MVDVTQRPFPQRPLEIEVAFVPERKGAAHARKASPLVNGGFELVNAEALRSLPARVARKSKTVQPLPGQQLVQLQLVTALVQFTNTAVAQFRPSAAAEAAGREVLSALSTVKDARKSAAA